MTAPEKRIMVDDYIAAAKMSGFMAAAFKMHLAMNSKGNRYRTMAEWNAERRSFLSRDRVRTKR